MGNHLVSCCGCNAGDDFTAVGPAPTKPTQADEEDRPKAEQEIIDSYRLDISMENRPPHVGMSREPVHDTVYVSNC